MGYRPLIFYAGVCPYINEHGNEDYFIDRRKVGKPSKFPGFNIPGVVAYGTSVQELKNMICTAFEEPYEDIILRQFKDPSNLRLWHVTLQIIHPRRTRDDGIPPKTGVRLQAIPLRDNYIVGKGYLRRRGRDVVDSPLEIAGTLINITESRNIRDIFPLSLLELGVKLNI